jgi:hypothetical protein
VISFSDPKFIIAYTIIVGFGAAYIFHPSDTMNGALIAAFAGAWGYYLGSSNSSSEVRGQVGKALDLAAAAQPPSTTTTTTTVEPNATGEPMPVTVVNTPAEPVPTSEEPGR